MPQKGYIRNKKNLPKLKRNETPEKTTEDDVEEQKIVASSPKAVRQETFSLYVRGAAWIKDRQNAANRLKEICPAIQNVRHPRQKSVDFCFIDFETAAERDKSYEELKDNDEIIVKQVIKDVNKLLEKRKKNITEKREAKNETRKLVAKIKKNQQSIEHPKEKTNQLIITNLPAQATAAELKQQFPTSVKINLKLKNRTKKLNSAIVTFSNPGNAFTVSQQSIVLHGQKLNVFLNTSGSFKAQSKNKRDKPTKQEDEEPKKKSAKVKA